MKSFVISIPIDEDLELCLVTLAERLRYRSREIAEAAHEGLYSEYLIGDTSFHIWSEANPPAKEAYEVEIVDLPILRPATGVQICGLEFLG